MGGGGQILGWSNQLLAFPYGPHGCAKDNARPARSGRRRLRAVFQDADAGPLEFIERVAAGAPDPGLDQKDAL